MSATLCFPVKCLRYVTKVHLIWMDGDSEQVSERQGKKKGGRMTNCFYHQPQSMRRLRAYVRKHTHLHFHKPCFCLFIRAAVNGIGLRSGALWEGIAKRIMTLAGNDTLLVCVWVFVRTCESKCESMKQLSVHTSLILYPVVLTGAFDSRQICVCVSVCVQLCSGKRREDREKK